MTHRFLHLLALLPAFAAGGCSTLETLPLVSDLPKVPVPDALKMEHTLDRPRTPIESALSGCDKRTEAGEAACVKSALTEAKTTMPALVAMLRGCQAGQICHVIYTTEDRVGLFSGTASHFVARWRVDIDLTKRPSTIDAVPITVVQV